MSSPPSSPSLSLSLQLRSPPPSWQPQRRRPMFFLHYSWRNGCSVVYDPFSDCWRSSLVPRFPTASSGSHLLITYDCFFDYRLRSLNDMVSSFYLYNPFTKITTAIPLPPVWQPYIGLGVVFDDDNNYKVAIFPWLAANFHIFDSRRRLWTLFTMPPHFNLKYMVNSFFFNGSLYVLSLQPNRVSIFNLEAHTIWTVAALPLITCKHLMAFEGRFFLAGFAYPQENAPDHVSIQIWEILLSEIARGRLVSFMPHQLLEEFCQNFDVESQCICSGAGIVCFFHLFSHRLVTFDLMSGTWTMASPSPFFDDLKVVWLGLALEPTPDELRPCYNSS